MYKPSLIRNLKENYSAFVVFINSLSQEHYDLSVKGKWSAGEHLAHLLLSVSPIVAVLQMDKNHIIEQFGTSDNHMRSYELMKASYIEKLGSEKKAPKRFDPAFHPQENRTTLCKNLTIAIEKLCALIETFTEEELDRHALPHPLLGKLSLREMLHNAIYHCLHHQNIALKALQTV